MYAIWLLFGRGWLIVCSLSGIRHFDSDRCRYEERGVHTLDVVWRHRYSVHGNFSTVISERNGQTYNPSSVHISLTLLIDEATRQALQHLDDDIKQNRDFLDSSFVSYFGILRSGLKTVMAILKYLMMKNDTDNLFHLRQRFRSETSQQVGQVCSRYSK